MKKLVGLGMLAVALLAEAGCVCCPLQPPPQQVETCRAVLGPARGHVYIFVVNGLDPISYCNFLGLHDYLVKLGYPRTYQGELYHCFWFKPEICKIHGEDPDARFVLIGHGLGAGVAHKLASSLHADNIPVHLLVYIDGDSCTDWPRKHPDNVEHVVNIRTPGSLLNSREVPGAMNVCFSEGSHFTAPTQESTLELLDHEVMKVALTVPQSPPLESPTIPVPELGPTPRPLPSKNESASRDDWDFLKPSKTLNAESPFRYPAPTATAGADEPPRQHTTLKPVSP
jgi:hypothetical protein